MDELEIQNAIVKAKPGLEKYQKIMSMVTNVDVSDSVEFQMFMRCLWIKTNLLFAK